MSRNFQPKCFPNGNHDCANQGIFNNTLSLSFHIFRIHIDNINAHAPGIYSLHSDELTPDYR